MTPDVITRCIILGGCVALTIVLINRTSHRGHDDHRAQLSIPWIGLGTAAIPASAVCDALRAADRVGIHLVDTAAQKAVWYRNEAAIGACLASVPGWRDRLFVTTKLHPADHGPRNAVRALFESLTNLQTTRIDLLIFHYAECWGTVCEGRATPEGSWQESWRALAPFVRNGTIGALGVSNFSERQLDQVLVVARETDAPLLLVQAWCDVLHSAASLRRWCARAQVHFQSYSPLGGQRWQESRNPVLTHPTIVAVAAAHKCTPAQAVLAWMRQRGISAVPRTTNPLHLEQNVASLQITLDDDSLLSFDRLAQDESSVLGGVQG